MNLGQAGQQRAAALLRGEAAAQFTGPLSIGLGLSADDTGLTGEPAGNGYARQTIVLGGSGNLVTNTTAAAFGPFLANLGLVRAFAIFDSAGNVMWRGDLSNQISLSQGISRTIAAGALRGYLD
jgi:hypothetical protein